MSEHPPDELSRTLTALSRTLLTDDTNLQDGLRRVAEAGCSLLANCAAASVTVIERGRAHTMGATNDTALELDRIQYDSGDGPCLSAAIENRTIRIDAVPSDTRWPAFNRTAGENGIVSSLSVPLHLVDGDLTGGLNVYGRRSDSFSEHDEQMAEAFAVQASIVVANARAYWAAFELTRNLTTAMETRAVIEQAKGILMGSHRIDADAAFELLRHRSQDDQPQATRHRGRDRGRDVERRDGR